MLFVPSCYTVNTTIKKQGGQKNNIFLHIKELKQRRRQRRGRHLVKNEYFPSEIRNCLYLFSTPMALIQFQTETRKISNRRSRFLDNVEVAHFIFLLIFAKDE